MPARTATNAPPAGSPFPLGPTPGPDGVNFSVFAPDATAARLLLFADAETTAPVREIRLDPRRNLTDGYWHVLVPEAAAGTVYGWRMEGPPGPGNAFAPGRLLLDPYAPAAVGLGSWDRQAASGTDGDNLATSLRGVVAAAGTYDWEGDQPLPAPAGREVIYELHVGGFTKHPSSGVAPERRGTFAGLADRVDHLRDLGVTSVELMPVQLFDPLDAPAGRTNVWGYSPLSWFAPHPGYSSDRSPLGPLDEFRDMVKALHRAGIRVIMDVVYNHTAEAGADGPIVSWRGFAAGDYYILDAQGHHLDVTGCGNTVNANHSVVRRLITDSLAWWVQEMHVDGFRFDLAAALSRGEDGEPLANPPVIWAIESEPRIAGRRLIAEAWDAAGLYQVGSFTGDRFAEWNGPFRDAVRRFLKGDAGLIETMMARIVGSPDLFAGKAGTPRHGINFVTAHDGFTLADLVAYDRKHNEANGEENRDGSNHNMSWNSGVEGPSDDPEVLALRRRRQRNHLCLLLLSHGTPMLLMGDEMGHSRRGNNNPWCQDNELNWLDWEARDREADLLRFVRMLLAFSAGLPILQENRWWTATSPDLAGDITWHGTEPGKPDWRPESRRLAYTLEQKGGERVHVMLNAATAAAEFTPPPAAPGAAWKLIIDTAALPPGDIHEPRRAPVLETPSLPVAGHSVVVLSGQRPGPVYGPDDQ